MIYEIHYTVFSAIPFFFFLFTEYPNTRVNWSPLLDQMANIMTAGNVGNVFIPLPKLISNITTLEIFTDVWRCFWIIHSKFIIIIIIDSWNREGSRVASGVYKPSNTHVRLERIHTNEHALPFIRSTLFYFLP